MKIDILCHLLDNLVIDVSHLPPVEDFLCRSFAHLSFTGDVFSVPTIYSSSAVVFQKVLCNLNLIRNSSVGLLSRSSDRLRIPGELFMPPTSYNSYSVGYQGVLSTGTGHGLHGSGFSTWAKFLVLPCRCVTAHFWIRCNSAGLLFVGHQLKRDFFLFISCSGVRQKHDWLRFCEDEAWRKPLPETSWLFVVFVCVIRWIWGSSNFLSELLRRFLSGGFCGYCVASLVLPLMKIVPTPALVSAQTLIHVTPPVLPPAALSSSASNFISGNIRLFALFLLLCCSVVQGDIIKVICNDLGLDNMLLRRVQRFEEIQDLNLSTRETVSSVICDNFLRRVPDFFAKRNFSFPTRVNVSLNLVIFLLISICCFVLWILMMICLKKGDDLLRQNWYPIVEKQLSGELKSSNEFFRQPVEDATQFWPFGIYPFGGVFHQISYKKIHRVVDHAPTIQAHPYVCGMLLLRLLVNIWILVTGFWSRDSDYEIWVTSCMFYFMLCSCNV